MKYFTPELFVQFQDVGPISAPHIHDAWERAVAAYQSQLARLLPDAPTDLRRLIEFGSLHDAHLLGMWQGHNQLTIVLQCDGDPARLFVLTYALIEHPDVNREALPTSVRSSQPEWLFDEIGVDGDQTVNGRGYTHDILLSNGWEIHLRFSHLTVERPSALLPSIVAPRSEDLMQQSA